MFKKFPFFGVKYINNDLKIQYDNVIHTTMYHHFGVHSLGKKTIDMFFHHRPLTINSHVLKVRFYLRDFT